MSKTTIPAGGLSTDSVTTAKIADDAVTSAKATGIGISAARQFRLTSNFSGSAQPIASNWEEADTDGYGGIGTISESSGIYSFGATGIYFIEFRALHQFDQADDYTNIIIQTTTDNSSYDTAAITNIGLDGQYHHFGTASFIFDVTNVSTHKVRFTVNGANGSNSTKGNTAENQTAVTFIRLGDT